MISGKIRSAVLVVFSLGFALEGRSADASSEVCAAVELGVCTKDLGAKLAAHKAENSYYKQSREAGLQSFGVDLMASVGSAQPGASTLSEAAPKKPRSGGRSPASH